MEMSRITATTETRSRGRLIVRMGVMVVLVALIAGAVVGYKMLGASKRQQAMRSQGGQAQVVSAEPAKAEDWSPQIAAVGTLKAVSGADLSFEVSGIVDEITFNSGDDVTAGTTLMRLRSQDDAARLASLQAMAQLAAVTNERNQQLSKSQNVSQATLDTNEANLKNARAQVAQQQAILDKKILRAPFSGHLGLRTVDKGQYVTAGTNVVTLQTLNPIYADFFMPQQDLDRVKTGQTVIAKVDTYSDLEFPGEITAINPKVDIANRNVLVRATIKNPDFKLFPGMYATVKVGAGETTHHITLPQTAITYSPYGDAVYVVDKKGEQLIARYAFVTLGETRGDMVAVIDGIKEGELVVTAGAIKLRNGAPVKIDNSVLPTTDQNPKPANP